MTRVRFSLLVVLVTLLTSCKSQPEKAALKAATVLPGTRDDGSILLPNQWTLRPAGKQIPLRDFPVNIAVHPGGQFAAILHSGYSANLIAVVDLKRMETVSHMNIEQGFYGLEFTKDGRHLYCSGAGDEFIHVFDFDNGNLIKHREIQLHDPDLRAVPAGIAIGKSSVFVANVWGDRVTRVDVLKSNVTDILLRTNAEPLLHASHRDTSDPDVEAAVKRAEVYLFQASPESGFPYACRLDDKRNRLYVSLWGQACVAVIDTKSNKVLDRWPTQEHPCEMALTKSGQRLFVANANQNTVTVLDTTTGKTVETLWAALFPHCPPGATPNSLALSPDEKTLFVANADINTVAVFDVSVPGKSKSLGFIPVGWYPTSVRVTPDGRQLLVANGKGLESKANPRGPQPGITSKTNTGVQYIASLMKGTLGVIDLPARNSREWDEAMAKFTADAYRCTPLRRDASATGHRSHGNPVPLRPGEASPIKNIIYIIKENRTYDQVLGDMPQGNGDSKLCIFPRRVTPNEHKISEQFVLLDNFYADAEISADGHEWSMGAYASDFVERTWPFTYGHNKPHKFPYPAEGAFPIATPAGGYIWDRAAAAGVSYRSYGEFVELFRSYKDPINTQVKGLKGHIDSKYPGFDLEYSDQKRADRFIEELHRFEIEGGMPRLQIVRLPNDHTHSTTKGFPTPSAYVADNDLAFGRILEAITKSKFWPNTAVFVVEDDAQNGPDHVDAHRTIAFVASPYTKHGAVDSTMYSSSSMLRTIELILGLRPMSQFDAAATPMFNSFQSKPDLAAYVCEKSQVDLKEKNNLHAWGSGLKMNFAKEDAADDLLLNEAIWRSVRGADSKMPRPVRAAFIFARDKDED